jgi:hypothetical protein
MQRVRLDDLTGCLLEIRRMSPPQSRGFVEQDERIATGENRFMPVKPARRCIPSTIHSPIRVACRRALHKGGVDPGFYSPSPSRARPASHHVWDTAAKHSAQNDW